jgi:hypothetical protein
MSLYIDMKFVNLLSPKLERFVRKSDSLWNMRCPICGDSQKNKMKARGYIYRQKSNLFFSCHNCGTSLTFGNFLKTLDKTLYKEYQMERFKNESSSNVAKPDFSLMKTQPVFNKKTKIDLPSVEQLNDDHSAKQFVIKRKIHKDRWNDLYYANDFQQFVKSIIPDYEKTLVAEDPRLIIPFYDEKKVLLGFQGRALSNSKVRYITIKLSDDNDKVYGLERLDKSRRIYVVEGPIDSMFIDNCVAAMDATLYNVSLTLGQLDYVFVYDNEPRNKDVCKHMKKTIELGKNICIWPKNIKEKDINDMVLAGQSVQSIIDSNTFNNHRAMLEFTAWKKV